MVVDFGQVLKSLGGRALIDSDAATENTPLTLGHVAANALMFPNKVDSGVVKVQKYDLALKVYKEGEVVLTDAEVDVIKSAISEGYAPLVCGQAVRMLS